MLSDILTYIRRIVKTSSNVSLTDSLLIDYVNRFYTYDVAARLQLFDLKTTWQLSTSPNQDRYNIPYDGNGVPQFQMLMNPAYCAGVQISLSMDRNQFFKNYPQFQTLENDDTGDGASTSYSFSTNNTYIIRGIVDVIGQVAIQNHNAVAFPSLQPGVWITAVNTNNNNMVCVDSPYSAEVLNGTAVPSASDGDTGYLVTYTQPSGQINPISTTYTDAGTINYVTGAVVVDFPTAVLDGGDIQIAYTPFVPGTPRISLLYNNTVTLRPVPAVSYMLEFQAYLTPASFLSTGQAVPFGYMTEYLARGAARKLLSDVGDIDQFNFYEQFFREQEMLVLRRNDRQISIQRTPTIFSENRGTTNGWNTNYGQGV